MARDRKVYGFRKPRAEALLALPLSGDQEFPEMRPRERRGKPDGSRLVRFEMTGDWLSNAADADFVEMDGTAIGSDTLLDPEGIFESLESGAKGLAMNQGGEYFAIQAKCPEDE